MNSRERTAAFNKARAAQIRAGLKIRKDTYGEIIRLLQAAEQRITQQLAAAPSDYQQFYLPKLQRAVRDALAAVGAESADIVRSGADASWQAGLDLVDKPLAAGGIQLQGLVPRISTEQLLAMRTFAVDRIKDVSVQLANKVTSELGMAIIGTQDIGTTIGNIQKLFGSQGRRRALTIVRTELGRAYAVAGQKRLDQAAEFLPGLKKQWRRSGKVHSRAGHDAIDGQVRAPDEQFLLPSGIGLAHPRDPKAPAGETINCGCESLPYMDNWDVATPGAKPFSVDERARSQRKAAMSIKTGATPGTPGGAKLSAAPTAAYRAAKRSSGPHAGYLRQQAQLPDNLVEKSIRSLERRIQEHQAWILDPYRKVPRDLPDWQVGNLVEKKWPKDIARLDTKAEVLRGLLADRSKS